MQGIGTGDTEYIVMIVAYAAMLVLFTILLFYKWSKERTGAVFTVFEVFVGLLQFFFALRICVLSFLLYLRYGYLPAFIGKATSADALDNANLDNSAQNLLIFWELLSIGGSDVLYAALTCLIYKWRLLLTADHQGCLSLVVVMNVVTSFVSVTLVLMQFAFNKATMAFVHATYYYVAFNYAVLSVLLFYYAYHLSLVVEGYRHRTDLAFQVREVVFSIRDSCLAISVAVFIRAVAIAVDNVGYRFLLTGSSYQVIWNIVFKYVFWIVPELVAVIMAGSAFVDTEDFHGVIAIQDAKNKGSIPQVQAFQDDEDRVFENVPNVEVQGLNELLEQERRAGKQVPNVAPMVSEVELQDMTREITSKPKQNDVGRNGDYIMLDDEQ
ncbi:ftsK [Acrasis kona]|uniref:FtsK n=1 Tax=Acrasis kona TaxID=1008807 RepID=A0AAW2YKV1_9EUKA